MAETTYERWMAEQGVPILRGHGVEDVWGVELAPWKRIGGKGAFVQMMGMEGYTGMYLAEIPPAGALTPEKHVYDELIYVLSGRGLTEVWNDQAGESRKNLFEWQAGSFFAPPINTQHRLINGSGSEPVRLLAVTSAPMVMDLFHSPDFVFNTNYIFDDRYDGRSDYFNVGERRQEDMNGWKRSVWNTNFIPDVRGTELDPSGQKIAGGRGVSYEMAGNVLVGHLAEWRPGTYHKAHYHIGGAIILILRSEGYSIMWPRELGTHPYRDGHADEVVRVDWREGSAFSPPTGWFHQHFITGAVPGRDLAIRYGSRNYGVQFHDGYNRAGSLVSLKDGGTMIEYVDEDQEIRRQFKQTLAGTGVPFQMPELGATADSAAR